MKKSMIAAVVAATAFAASANADYWQITGAAADAGTNPPSPFNITHGVISQTLTVGGSSTAVTPNAGLAADFYDGTIANFGAGTLNFFGFDDGGGNSFFGFAFNNTTGAVANLSFTTNSSVPAASLGAVVDGFSSNPTISLVGSNSTSNISVSVADTGYALFLWAGTNLGQINMSGSVSDGIQPPTVTVNWLNVSSGGAFTVAQTDSTNPNSGIISLGTAAYVVPVPAPALLAGAGLVGAAALRRRMAKKA